MRSQTSSLAISQHFYIETVSLVYYFYSHNSVCLTLWWYCKEKLHVDQGEL